MPRRARATALLAIAVATALTLASFEVIAPDPVLAATTLAARCNDIGLRTRPSLSATRLARIAAATRVAADAKVTGGRWSRRCAGVWRSGSGWYRITRIDGTSVQALYGVRRIYAPAGLFRTVSEPKPVWAACDGTRLRTRPDGASTAKMVLSAGTRVTTFGAVTGVSWTTRCTGSSASGSTWYRIIAIDGVSVWKLFGRTVLYGAKGRFATSWVTTAAPVPTPTAAPTTAPTAAPTAAPTPSASPSPTSSPSPTPAYIEGIDVSHWQGKIDWRQVAAAGKRFAFLKASDSIDFVDSTYATNRLGAKANGLYVGAYHFARPDATPGDAVAEADHFMDTAAPIPGELLPVLDLEQTGGLATADLQAWVKAFLGRVFDRTGIRAVIYTSPSFWSNKMGNTKWFAANGHKILWIAHWTTASSPTVPAGDWNGNGWTFWQYTSDGSVPGISGRVDLDRYRLTEFAPVLVK